MSGGYSGEYGVESQLVSWREDGHVLILSLDDQETRNSLSPTMIDAVCDALDRFDKASHLRCAVLTGTDRSFCSGGNPKRMLEPIYREATADEITRHYALTFHRIPLALAALSKPLIAAINGHAIGAGLDIACYCDIRLAVEDAKFASSFVKLGLVPGDGGAWILPRIVGAAKAAELMLTGTAIDAQEAKRVGLVSEVVPAAELLDRALILGRAIAENPPHSVRLIKQLQRISETLTLEEALGVAAQTQAIAQQTDDHVEAVKAMLERRAANFSGQ